MAPFHPDPSQRIAVLHWPSSSPCLVLRVGALLEFLGNDVGSKVAWKEWKNQAVVTLIHLDLGDIDPFIPEDLRIWVSGCRMFSLYPTESVLHVWVEVHDFSVRGRANYLKKFVNEGLAEVRGPSPTRVRARVELGDVLHVNSGHDSIAFFEVSVPAQFCSPWK
jgi:hypothetical protein